MDPNASPREAACRKIPRWFINGRRPWVKESRQQPHVSAPRYKCLSRMSRHTQQLRDHDTNPCVAETDASRKCMDDNNYKKDMCTAYFLKYKNCRKFWHDIMMQRKRNGVKPEMPTAEERIKILESMGKPY